MADPKPPPAMEEAMPTTPDIVLDGGGYKADESLEGDKDGEASDAKGDMVEEGAEACGDDVVAAEPVGITEDPNQADVTKADETEEGASVDVQTDEVSASVDDLTEAAAASTFSTPVDDPTEVGAQTYEVTAAVDDLTEVGAALASSAYVDDPTEVGAAPADDDSNIVSTGGVYSSDDQTGQEVGGGSLDDADEAAHLVNDVQDAAARMEKNVAISGDGEYALSDEGQQMGVATALLNEVAIELVKAGDRAAEDGTNMDMQVQTGVNNEVEGIGKIAATAADEGKHTGAAAMIRNDNTEKDLGAASVHATNEGIQTDRVVLAGDDDEQKEVATADNDRVEEEGMQMDAVPMTGNMDEEGRFAFENIADEAVDVAVGIDVPEEKVQMDGAVDEVPEEETAEMNGAGLTGIDNEQKEVGTTEDDGVEEDTVQMDAAATTNDEDEEDGVGGEDVAEETVDGRVGDDVPEEEAAHMDEDDDDEPPPLMTRKGGGRRKRGRPSSKVQAVKPSIKRKDEEEVCFICFDGGDLVVCDRRGCPKAYHPSCVNRDDDFFKSKGRWNCGWHICSNCQKPARHMCYTCTYSLCKVCIKEMKFVSVRGFKGFCETCMNTVMLIENKEEATDQMDVDFDDKSSWWYLFKDYWLNLKTNLSMTVEEISAAKSQKSGSSSVIRDNDLGELPDTNDEEANSESSPVQHLDELINRSLIQPVDFQFDGRVYSCQVHDMILDLIVCKAVEENFVTVFTDRKQMLVSQDRVRRLAFDYHGQENVTTYPMVTNVRTLNIFRYSEQMPPLSDFGALRVLDLDGNENLENNYLEDIGKLFQLRYLRIKASNITLPEQIGELQFLVILDLLNCPNLSELPASIVKLRHLKWLIAPPVNLPDGVGNMQALEFLSLIVVDYTTSVTFLQELGSLTKLRTLGLDWRISDVHRYREIYADTFVLSLSILAKSNLQYLTLISPWSLDFLLDSLSPPPHLQELGIKGWYLSNIPVWMATLANLTYLDIEVKVRQETLHILGDFPALLFLKLYSNPVGTEERCLVVSNNGFQCLKKFSFVGWVNLMFKEGAMPVLETLEFQTIAHEVPIACGIGPPDLGIRHLLALRNLIVNIHCEGARIEEVEATEAAIRIAAGMLPNHPEPSLHRLGVSDMVKDGAGIEKHGHEEDKRQLSTPAWFFFNMSGPREGQETTLSPSLFLQDV